MTASEGELGGMRPAGWIASPSTAFPRGIIEGMADILAIEQALPESVVPATMYECLARSAALRPEKAAILALMPGGSGKLSATITYSQYLARVTAAANMFRHVAGDDRSVVGVMLPIMPEALIAAWGAVAAGVAAPINPHLEPALVAAILRAIGATVLVTTKALGPSAADKLDEIVSQVPSLRQVLLVDGRGEHAEFADELARHSGDDLTFEPCRDREAEAMYLPTGGTTAAPKLARLKHGGLTLSGWIAGAIMGAQEDEVIGVGMPLFHVGGLLMLSGRALVLAQTALLLSPAGFRDRGLVANFWDIARAHSMTSLIATPTTAASLASMDGADHHGHVIRTFTCGGSTVPLELGKQFPEKFGIELREVWGSTEFHGFLGCQPNGGKPLIGSVGLRTPWHDIKAVQLDENNRFLREVPPGEQGIIIGRGPCLALGYVDPAFDGQFFVTQGPDGHAWGSSGDLGRVDSDGWVWIDGRAKDVIIRGGHNIDPALIEEVLVKHPAVLHAAAIGFPDAAKGELPVAYVELVPGTQASPDELLAHCRGNIQERAAYPVSIFILETMPLTPVGKIFKPALREQALRAAVTRTAMEIAKTEPVAMTVNMNAGRPRVSVEMAGIERPVADALLAALRAFSFEVEPVRGKPEG